MIPGAHAPSWLMWSLPLGIYAGVQVRLHWSLMVLAVIQVASFGPAPWWNYLLLLAVPFFSVLLHEFGHIVAARLVGGGGDRILMWAMGGLAMCSAPMTPARQFAIAAGGPLVNVLIILVIIGFEPRAVVGLWGDIPRDSGLLVANVTWIVSWELMLILFNLLPCYPMDGGRMLRAMVWPWLGYARAQIATLRVAWVVLVLMVVWALAFNNSMLILLAAMLAFSVYQEQRQLANGIDLYAQEDAYPRHAPAKLGWFARWRAKRRQARAEADEALVNQLLDKVSRQGLPALTNAERKKLASISQRRHQP